MRRERVLGMTLLLVAGAFAASASAGTHADYVGPGPFATGPEVTKKCLECHEKEARAFLTSAHWTWSKKQSFDGRSIEIGKKNIVNNFCIAVPSNWPRCTSCHAGYGWKDASFDFTKVENMDCLVCHDTTGAYRKFPRSVSYGTGSFAMGCTDCHRAEAHKSALLARHARRIACQTCHIPAFAKDRPTKVWWDWSTAGKDVKPEDVSKDKYGEKLYDKMKGDFAWAKDVVPTYLWYDGTVDRVLLGDKVDPSHVVRLTSARGNRGDPKSKIFPFKIMRGKQPYDSGNRTVAVANVFGPEGYWAKYDWNLAITNGMAAAGQPYSGKFGWIETSMVWPVNHMVAPREAALKCADCHSEKGRMDWKALGYKGDPRKSKGD